MINYFSETEEFLLEETQIISDWLETCAEKEGYEIDDINYIFCDDEYLLEINRKHLDHDYYTDIITFDYCDDKLISGDIFISVERVKDNSMQNTVSFENELARVMIHGILHFMNYNDHSEEEMGLMRETEDKYLNNLKI